MGIYVLKPRFQRFLSPLKELFILWRVSPTVINLLALVISMTGALALFYAERYNFLLIYIPIMAFIRTALNALDGLVARKLKVKNKKFGEVLNESTDRFSDAIIFGSLLFVNYVNVRLAGLTIALILLNSYVGIVGKSAGGERQYIGLIGKADRMLYLSITAILILIFGNLYIMNYFLIFLIIGTTISITQRFIAIKEELYENGG